MTCQRGDGISTSVALDTEKNADMVNKIPPNVDTVY